MLGFIYYTIATERCAHDDTVLLSSRDRRDAWAGISTCRSMIDKIIKIDKIRSRRYPAAETCRYGWQIDPFRITQRQNSGPVRRHRRCHCRHRTSRGQSSSRNSPFMPRSGHWIVQISAYRATCSARDRAMRRHFQFVLWASRRVHDRRVPGRGYRADRLFNGRGIQCFIEDLRWLNASVDYHCCPLALREDPSKEGEGGGRGRDDEGVGGVTTSRRTKDP